MDQWEWCVVETSTKEPVVSFEDYVIFHFYSPDGYLKLSTGAVLFDLTWETMNDLKRRELLNRQGWTAVNYHEAIAKLLQEGWEPLGTSLTKEGALIYNLRRRYAPEEEDL